MKRATPRRPLKREPATEPGDQRRVELLEAAYVLIAEKGLEGLRTRDIAARAGVNISTLHYYFGTKEALIVAVVDHVNDKFTAPPPGRRGEAPSWDASPTLLSHLESAWRSFQNDAHLSTVLQELVVRASRDAAARAAFKALHLSWNRIVEDLLRAEVEQGRLRADLDAQAGARIVTSFIMGAMMQLGVNPKAFDYATLAKELERWAGSSGAPRR
ncbi:TetR/AcrR family transcriptional regulator [Pyxidicoccus parkwayensis]|uniref:TetR/AcrR family transcriptional regulator n=1 Tax=Pyxidicoccus parkwayensis TaxID=2813578 RepID=A0ABX7P6E0_9BACT|nr:TetR/AcrR family transcriptional regulator [Pyxidicoccus parkwaysis]QSQ26023.1 TetR/AcrR family transcriptional regulator [Pyxidicoccus parkwaysis]